MKHTFIGADKNNAKEFRTFSSGQNSGSRTWRQTGQIPAAGRYRPGYPIAPELWDTFMQSRRWEDAPKVFMPLYAEEKKARKKAGVADTENSILGQTAREPVFFGIHLACGGKEFADAVDKNEMLRILCAETVRWRLPVTDFVLLDDALHMIVCLDDPAKTAQEGRMENDHKDQMENTQESQMKTAQEHQMKNTQEGWVKTAQEYRMENTQESRVKKVLEIREGAVPENMKSGLSGERWQTYMLNQFALSLERRYQEYYAQRMELPCTFLTQDVLCRYSDPGQVLEACCRMHALPIKLGLTDDIRFYWFSGYNTVRGKFAWNFMDPTELLKTMSNRPDKAVRQYLAAHRAMLAGIAAGQKL